MSFRTSTGRTNLDSKAYASFLASGLQTTFDAKAQATNGSVITIYDVIGTDATNANTFAQALEDAQGGPVTINLSSPGGSVFEGYAMFNSLRNYSGATTVNVMGVCASIATVVALGADVVNTAQTSLWMIHCGWLATVGNAAELRESAAVLDKIDQNIMAVYAAKTGEPAARWGEIMSNETWFTADEALAAKLVNQIISTETEDDGQEEAKIRAGMDMLESNLLLQAQLRVRRKLVQAII